MSALTKVFVVLHVVMSLLLAAGLVVFVNKVENFNVTMKTQSAELARATDAARAAGDERDAVKSAAQQQVTQAANQLTTMQRDLAEANTKIQALTSQVAEATAQNATQGVAMQTAQAAQQAAQQNQGILQQQLADLRGTSDKLMQQYTDANLAITRLTNERDTLNRRLRDTMEELTATQEASVGSGAGGGAGPTGRAPGARTAVANVNGEIRAKETIAGVDYATISLGSADAIARDMKLPVLGGRNNAEFLGYVEIEAVEANEATGRLTGPRAKEIRARNRVVSSL